jgi:ABC-type multidrug transport system fused ATPase/permease subunit
LVLFVALIDRFFEPIRDLSQQYNVLQAAMVAGERVFEVLDVEPEVRDAPDAYPLPPISGRVDFDAVRFGYGETEILHGIDLHVSPGQTVAFVGETGAGKTSMVNLLLRFADVWSGRVAIDGHDVRAVIQESLRSQLGIVLQDTFLFAGSVRANIAFGRPEATPRRSSGRRGRWAPTPSSTGWRTATRRRSGSAAPASRPASGNCSPLPERSWPTPGS